MKDRKRIPFGRARDDLVIRLIAERVPVGKIAEQIGITRQALHLNLKRLGLDARDVRVEKLAELAARRASEEEIAAALSIEQKSAYYVARKLGLRRARRVRTKEDGVLRALYWSCLSGDPNWLNIAERPRSERIQLVLSELQEELVTCTDPEPVLRAIELWRKPESEGPSAQEVVQHHDWRSRMRAAG